MRPPLPDEFLFVGSFGLEHQGMKSLPLLDTRFRAAPPEFERLTLEQVAEALHCRGRTVLRMIERGTLHPVEESGEMFFEHSEVERVRNLPISPILLRLIPRT